MRFDKVLVSVFNDKVGRTEMSDRTCPYCSVYGKIRHEFGPRMISAKYLCLSCDRSWMVDMMYDARVTKFISEEGNG